MNALHKLAITVIIFAVFFVTCVQVTYIALNHERSVNLKATVGAVRYSNHDVYWTFGNQYQQATNHFAALSNFSEVEYLADVDKCGFKNGKCITKTQSWWQTARRDQIMLWAPVQNSSSALNAVIQRKKIDCQYSLHPVMVVNADALYSNSHDHFDGTTLFHMNIVESSCVSPGMTAAGGATFEILAYNKRYLLSCRYLDSRNGSYAVECKHPGTYRDRASNHQLCLQVTVVLYYEHGDSFSDLHALTYSCHEKYPPTRHVVADNVSLCFDYNEHRISAVANHRHVAMTNLKARPPAPQQTNDTPEPHFGYGYQVHWYSGFWAHRSIVNSSGITANFDQMPKDQHAFYYNLGNQSFSNYAKSGEYEPLNISIASMSVAPSSTAVDPAMLGDQYVFQPCQGFSVADNGHHHSRKHIQMTTHRNHHNRSSGLHQPLPGNRESHYHHRTMQLHQLPNILAAESSISDASTPPKQYYFVGTSHMRYTFNAFVDYFGFADSVLNGLDRKHDDYSFRNLHYYRRWFAGQQAEFLQSFCAPSTPKGPVTVIMQVGAWDMAYFSLRSFIRSPNALPKLLSTLEDIFTGRMPCHQQIEHLVWVTTVPYPVCLGDVQRSWTCETARVARNNPAIAAGNEFIVRALGRLHKNSSMALTSSVITSTDMNSTSAHSNVDTPKSHTNSSHFKISVVDAFGIVLPRVLLFEKSEWVCGNHLLCKVDDAKTIDGQTTSRLMYTPGGEAIVRSLLLALS